MAMHQCNRVTVFKFLVYWVWVWIQSNEPKGYSTLCTQWILQKALPKKPLSISPFSISSFRRSWRLKRCAILRGYDRKVVIRLMWYQSFFQFFCYVYTIDLDTGTKRFSGPSLRRNTYIFFFHTYLYDVQRSIVSLFRKHFKNLCKLFISTLVKKRYLYWNKLLK